MKSQKGFALLESLLIIVILAILGFTGWYVWHAKQNTDKIASQNNTVRTETAVTPKNTLSSWKTYSSTAISGLSFKYPGDWKLTKNPAGFDGTDSVDVVSPAGTDIYWGSGGAGFGGTCDGKDYMNIISVDPIKNAKGLYAVYWQGVVYSGSSTPGNYYHLEVHDSGPSGGAPKTGKFTGCIYPGVFNSKSGGRALALSWKTDENSIKQPPKELSLIKQVLETLSY